MSMFHRLLMAQNSKKDYVQDGLVYQGIPLSSSPASVSLPNGEFTVEIVNELIAKHESTESSAVRVMFRMWNENPSEATNQFGNLRNTGLMYYFTKGNMWTITADQLPATNNTLGDKRTSTFVYDNTNLKSFYYNGELQVERQANSTFSRTDYNLVYVSNAGVYFNYFNVRIYDRVLSPAEIAHNYEIDKERYLS